MGLSAIGLSFAHWEETLYIDGIMYTDDIDPAFRFALSNDPCDSGFMPDPWECGVWDMPSVDLDNWHGLRKDKNVACTDVEILPDPITGDPDHLLHITIMDAYPCYYTHPYFEIVNYGSVPINLYSYKITELSFDIDPFDTIPPIRQEFNRDMMVAGTTYYVRWVFDAATDEWVAQISTNVGNPDNWDFSIERTDDNEMGVQLDPWRWGNNPDFDVGDHIDPDAYTDILYGDLCIHFLNSCEQLAMYDFKLELVFWNWPEGGEGCDPPDDGIPCNGDIFLVLDTSGSIDPDERLIAAEAAKGFVDALMLDNAQIGITQFNTLGSMELALSNDAVLIKSIIDAVYAPWDPAWLTNLYEGLMYSRIQLNTNDRPDVDFKDYMVVITDGQPNEPGDNANAEAVALAEANAAKGEGMTIFVVGVGDELDPAYCQQIASTPDDYYPAADWNDLADLLATLVNCPPT
jgi:hypothetical protein